MLVPFAAGAGPAAREALATLRLSHLRRLLARLGVEATDAGEPESLSMPHERVLARAWGLPATDGLVPLAALAQRQAGHDPGTDGWAWITPTHWRVGRDHIDMAAPRDLQLDADDSRALLAAMQPFFTEDGIALAYDAPSRWIARADVFRGLPSASLDRVAGRTIDRWMPSGDAGRPLRRLQQEMQMLLYTLPLNDARERGGRLPVNTFWVSGTGALPAGHAAPDTPLETIDELRDPALAGDWQAWAAAWEQVDAREGARLLQALDQGRTVRLTLCGESGSRTWSSTARSGWQRVAALFSTPSPAAALEGL